MKHVHVEEQNILKELSKGTELYYCTLGTFQQKTYHPITSQLLRSNVLLFKLKDTVILNGKEVKRPLTLKDIKNDKTSQSYYVASLNRPEFCYGPVSKDVNVLKGYVERNIVFRNEDDAIVYGKALSKLNNQILDQ